MSIAVTESKMDTDSDDGEPRLKIVDEPMALDIKTEAELADNKMTSSPGSNSMMTSLPTMTHRPPGFGAFRKSFSYDGGVEASSGTAAAEAAARRMKSIAEESNANEAIESLLMLGREQVLSPSRERSNSFSLSPIGRRFSSSSDVSFELRPSESAQTLASSTTMLRLPQSKNGRDSFKGSMSYYQRMRERNNEASKRCRLKRRMKADSQEHQAHNLHMSNKFLRQRISKLEKICVVVKDGVKRIQSKDCRCLETVAKMKKANMDSPDISNLSNKSLIESSRTYREQIIELIEGGGTGNSSGDEEPMTPTPSSPAIMAPMTPLPQSDMGTNFITFPGRSELSVTPVLKLQALAPPPRSPSSPMRMPAMQQQKTALDAINDTIIQSLSTSNPSANNLLPQPQINSCLPLNLVKIVPATRSSNTFKPISSSPLPMTLTNQIILLSAPPRTALPMDLTDNEKVLIKCEPEIQIVECDPPQSGAGAKTEPMPLCSEEVDPTLACIAAAHGNAGCTGNLLNLNKLTSYLDLVTRNVTRDSGKAAMERAIIKSRLRIPFWQADEVPTFICERHRYDIVHSSIMQACSMCNKKRTKKALSPQSIMMTITFRMSLENYTTTGKILPIGLLVCSHCKDKHLKGVDFGNSQVIGPADDVAIESSSGGGNGGSVSITTVNATNVKRWLPPAAPSAIFLPPTAISLKKEFKSENSIPGINGDEVRVAVQPVVRPQAQTLKVQPSSPSPRFQVQQQSNDSPHFTSGPAGSFSSTTAIPAAAAAAAATLTTSVPPSSTSPVQNPSSSSASSSENNIFTKIGRLNAALQAINPSYKPIGFSITSIESCSKSVLEDATLATETAVATLLSVIAPRNEAFLWDSIKPKLDAKLLSGVDLPQDTEAGGQDKPNARQN